MVVENPGEANMRMLIKDGKELKQYHSSGEIGEGQGSKAGVTYQLNDGRMIYVPGKAADPTRPYAPPSGHGSNGMPIRVVDMMTLTPTVPFQ